MDNELPKAAQNSAGSLLRQYLAWSDVASLIQNLEDFLETKYESDPWLWEFTDPHATLFTSSRERFMADSTVTLHRLRRFEKDWRLRELMRFMLNLPEKFRNCFIYICTELIARDEDKDLSAGPISVNPEASMVDPYNLPTLENLHSRHLEIANTIVSQNVRYMEKLMTSEVRTSKKEPLQTFSLLPRQRGFKIVNT